MIDAGKLDRRIDLLSAAETQNSVGQVVRGFSPVATVYAQRLELRTSDAARSGQRDAFTLAKFRIRYRAGVTTGMRVRDGERTYDIVAVDEAPERRTALFLMVEEVRA